MDFTKTTPQKEIGTIAAFRPESRERSNGWIGIKITAAHTYTSIGITDWCYDGRLVRANEFGDEPRVYRTMAYFVPACDLVAA